ncbi:Hypothetical_protein [Hexamita inflata]|uniref:Hypothetical_protein n=1 Tax=Hexamita inflata TaxID=28002 RepID=A0ABP1HQZ8_9EUKA
MTITNNSHHDSVSIYVSKKVIKLLTRSLSSNNHSEAICNDSHYGVPKYRFLKEELQLTRSQRNAESNKKYRLRLESLWDSVVRRIIYSVSIVTELQQLKLIDDYCTCSNSKSSYKVVNKCQLLQIK